MNKTQLQEHLIALNNRLKSVDERLTNPMASEETIRELLKTKNELLADIQTAEVELSKLNGTGKKLERSLNESYEL